MLCKSHYGWLALAAVALPPLTASAQAGASSATAAAAATDAAPLAPITVTATRTERAADDVPGTVTVVPTEEIERSGARDIKDVFRNEIDVTVRAAATRFTAAGSSTGRAGNEGINIRGLEGNQVLMLVDGIRVPNAFSFGSFATGRGDFLNLDGTQAIEVLRGPASTQYGSDGLAGVVSLRTLAPGDVLKAGKGLGGFVRLGYDTVDASWGAAVAAAGRSGAWQALLLASLRRGHETRNQGSNDVLNSSRTAPNPVDHSAPAMLGKLLFDVDAQHQLGFTLDAQRRSQVTEVYSARAVPPLAATSTLDLDAQDRVERQRVSLEHRYTNARGTWLQRAETRAYTQDAEVRQFAAEDRNAAADRTRDNRYAQKVAGVSTQLESNFGGAGLAHRLSYGAELSRSTITGVRSGTVPPPGETYPTLPFPDTRYTQAGVFVQDEVEAGIMSLIPGLRVDQYKLVPSADGYTGGAVVALSDRAATPRLGVVLRLDPAFAPYGQWAKGFRAPAPDQVNNGFTNVTSFYRSIGNPDLKAERAESLEIGVRGKLAAVRWQVAGFDNRYRDFISQEQVSGSGTAASPTVFQYVNLATARIRGIELRGEWQVDPNWSVKAGSALVRGQLDRNGVSAPLDSVEPLRTVLSLRYDTGSLGFSATALHSQGKGADRINPIRTATGTTPAFATPASNVVDLGAYWQALPNLRLNANLNNVFDETYWRWSDVRGLADSSTVKDAYTAPGRSLQVSARYDF